MGAGKPPHPPLKEKEQDAGKPERVVRKAASPGMPGRSAGTRHQSLAVRRSRPPPPPLMPIPGEQRTRLYKLCFNLYDADGSGEISLVELQMYRGERTEAKLGMTQYQKDTLIWLFKNSKFLDNSGSIDLAEFTLLFENEPRYGAWGQGIA